MERRAAKSNQQGSEMTGEQLQTHGWKDLHIDSDAMARLTSRAFRLYSYLVFRARNKSRAMPGIDRIVADLTIEAEIDGQKYAESWSPATVKRTLAECEAKEYIIRQRRPNTSSITHVFKTPAHCRRFKRRLTHEPSVSSPMSQPVGSPMSHKVVRRKEYEEEDTNPPRTLSDIENALLAGSFGLPPNSKGGYALGRLVQWLSKNAASHTAAHVTGFYTWYNKKYNEAAAPRKLEKFADHYLAYMADQTSQPDGAAPALDPETLARFERYDHHED
jgi:DNA-binding MarR family transcriptional regulator